MTPLFQRRHYEFLARYFKDIKPCDFSGPVRYAWEEHVEQMCRNLSEDNRNFKREQFLTACTYNRAM